MSVGYSKVTDLPHEQITYGAVLGTGKTTGIGETGTGICGWICATAYAL
jgi:hypothetical protein